LCAGAFLGVVVVGAGSVSIAVSLSCTAAPSVISLVTTMIFDGVDSSTKGGVCSSFIEVEVPVSDDDEAMPVPPST
jgi:hypothetical protein